MRTTAATSEQKPSDGHPEIDCRVCVLGGLRIEARGVELGRLPTQKTALLAAYLASFPTRTHPREELIEMLWPECGLEEGRNRLRVALSAIRRRFHEAGIDPDTVLDVDRVAARINPRTCSTDALLFERALRREKDETDRSKQIAILEGALALYGGDLLPGFYEEWVIMERQRLADLHAALLRRVGKLYVEAGEYERAIEYIRKAVETDPLSEATHRTLIRLYMACHRPAAAQRQYETLKSVLARELHMAPSAQTQDLARKLTQRAAETGTPSQQSDERPSARAPRQALPTVPTSFIGRDGEMAALQELLEPDINGGRRFVTLTGPVGVGKSRLAIEALTHLADTYDGRVFYARIAGFESSEAVLRSVADALQISAAPQTEAFSAVAETLAQAHSLLVLDDADLLGAGALRIIGRLLEWAPDLRVLATSRRVFGVADERIFSLKPLLLPGENMAAEELLSQPSARLLLDRAQAAHRNLHVDPENARTFIGLCLRLEGIPLAIELAATWMRVLTPESMLNRLSRRFDLMRPGSASPEASGDGLYEAISLSYRLLPDNLRRLLTRLSVLRGDWTIATAEAVCGAEANIQNVLELSLRSFVLGDAYFGEMRFRMLDTLRDYADEQLAASDRAAIMETHAGYFERQIASYRAQRAPEHARWLSQIDLDYENYLAALAWRKQQGDFGSGMRLGSLLWRYWYERGLHAEGLTWLTFFLERSTEGGEHRVEALFGAARFAISLGENASAAVHLTEALAAARAIPHCRHTVSALAALVILARDAHDYDVARTIYREWLALPIQPHQIWERMPALQGLLQEAQRVDDTALHKACLERIVEVQNRLGDPSRVAQDEDSAEPRAFGGYVFLELGQAAMSQGDDDTAKDLYAEGLELYRECRDDRGIALACAHLAGVSLRLRDVRAAREYALESLTLERRSDSRHGIAATLLALAHIEELRGFPREADIYRRDALRYACEYEWLQRVCEPFEPGENGREASIPSDEFPARTI